MLRFSCGIINVSGGNVVCYFDTRNCTVQTKESETKYSMSTW